MLKGNNNDEQMLYLASPKIAANFNLSFMKEVLSFFPCSTWHCKLWFFSPFLLTFLHQLYLREGVFGTAAFLVPYLVYQFWFTSDLQQLLFPKTYFLSLDKSCEEIVRQGTGEIVKKSRGDLNKLVVYKKYLPLKTWGLEKVPYSKSSCPIITLFSKFEPLPPLSLHICELSVNNRTSSECFAKSYQYSCLKQKQFDGFCKWFSRRRNDDVVISQHTVMLRLNAPLE